MCGVAGVNASNAIFCNESSVAAIKQGGYYARASFCYLFLQQMRCA
jgi:hypothetical protein